MFHNTDQWSASAQHILKSFPRGKDSNSSVLNNCQVPFRSLVVDLNGDCFLCECDAWLPLTVGNILDFESLHDIWQSSRAKEIQQDITDKKFTHCAIEHCGILTRNIKRSRFSVSINIDESCNLACPTCRRQSIFHKSGSEYDRKVSQVEHLVKMINDFDQPLDITISGNGDPLASLIMRPVLLKWKPRHNQRMKLFTNGLLLEKMLNRSEIVNFIDDYRISVDAGSAEVYAVVRRPGNFQSLKENLTWLSENKNPNAVVTLLFCVSSMNVSDIKNFANLCAEFNFRGALTKVNNWYTLDDFENYDVASNSDHPMYQTLVEQLTAVSKMPNIFLNSCLTHILRH